MEKDVQHLLGELRAAIEHSETSPESRAELEGLVEAIQDRLAKDDHEGLRDVFHDGAARLETEHPKLSETLRDVIHWLGASGL